MVPQVVFQHPSREEKAAPMSDPEIGGEGTVKRVSDKFVPAAAAST